MEVTNRYKAQPSAKPEPNDLVDITFSGAAAGDGNAITGYELYSDTSEFGSFTTLVMEEDTNDTFNWVAIDTTNMNNKINNPGSSSGGGCCNVCNNNTQQGSS